MLYQSIVRSVRRPGSTASTQLLQAGLALGTAVICFTPAVAQAHPGHESTHGLLAGLAHPIGGLDHVLAMVTVGLWAAQLGGRARWAMPLAFLTVMTIGGGLGQVLPTFAGTEPMVLLSNVILGLCLLMAWRLPLAAGVTLVGGLALFHGLAHGAEIPAGSNALHYAIGFLLSTALLHGLGLVGGLGLQGLRLGGTRSLRWFGAAVVSAGLWLMVA